MKLFTGISILIFAVLISGVAAFFSIFGLAELFSAAMNSVILMGVVLEFGKLISAAWLHANWHNKAVTFFHKAYLCVAICALMLITAIGIYGYLSKGYLEQEAPLAGIQLNIEQIQSKTKAITDENNRLKADIDLLDKSINVFLNNDKATQGIAARDKQKAERQGIQKKIDDNFIKLQTLNEESLPLKAKIADVSAKLGPVKYVADLFGWKDPNIAVRMVILILMVAFDPLAVVLVISGTISIGEWNKERKKTSNTPESIKEEIFQNIVATAPNKPEHMQASPEAIVELTVKEKLLEMLEKNPEIVNDILEVADEEKKKLNKAPKGDIVSDGSWLSNTNTKTLR